MLLNITKQELDHEEGYHKCNNHADCKNCSLHGSHGRTCIVASGDELILDQIEKQLLKLEDVLDIKKLEPGLSVTRELILVKIRAKDTERQPIMNVTEIFHGKIVDVTNDSMVIQLVGHQDKLDAFLDLLDGYEILELARTGITGLTRGSSDVRFLD